MKKYLLSWIPRGWIDYYKAQTYQKARSPFYRKKLKDTFQEIYESNHWESKDSISGRGSEMSQTRALRKALPSLLSDYQVRTILDIPCGDFHWMKEVELSGTRYTGADIVPRLIDENRKKYEQEGRTFEVLDLTSNPLPKSDLILCRDCLVHLSYDAIRAALSQIVSSESRYLLCTSFPEKKRNYDISSGDWRALNMEIAPFHFPRPLVTIREDSDEDKRYRDKSICLWEIKTLFHTPILS